MHQAHEAVNMYHKGIEILKKDFIRYQQLESPSQATLCLKQQASALASIAELYMTEPLCDDDDAEEQCEVCLDQALQIDP